MSTRYRRARFHIATGPASLFARVRFKLAGQRTLSFQGRHAAERLFERDAPYELLRNFDSDYWELITAEVRTDSGKFVRTGWRVRHAGRDWWVVIGYDGVVQTVFASRSEKSGRGPTIVTDGALYAFVERVNRELMTLEALVGKAQSETPSRTGHADQPSKLGP
jgi:hypothetical protein